MSEIKPALSPEEWGEAQDDDYLKDDAEYGQPLVGIGIGYTTGYLRTGMLHNPFTPHALAALCLHGQTFGFTWADVDLLKSAEDEALGWAEIEGAWEREHTEEAMAFALLAKRIAALLPPRTP